MKMSKLGKKLIAAANEGIAIARGEADPASYRLHVPREIDVRAMRRRLGLTQEQFALSYGFTLPRVRDWEQGRSAPDGAVRAYLKVIEREPEAVERALKSDSDLPNRIYDRTDMHLVPQRNDFIIEKRTDSRYKVSRANADRVVAVADTQAEAIERVRSISPNATVYIERVRELRSGRARDIGPGRDTLRDIGTGRDKWKA
jgi:putative transcriptional regulator